jgi:hypothetical protein
VSLPKGEVQSVPGFADMSFTMSREIPVVLPMIIDSPMEVRDSVTIDQDFLAALDVAKVLTETHYLIRTLANHFDRVLPCYICDALSAKHEVVFHIKRRETDDTVVSLYCVYMTLCGASNCDKLYARRSSGVANPIYQHLTGAAKVSPGQFTCRNCSKLGGSAEFKRCSACKTAFYCSKG